MADQNTKTTKQERPNKDEIKGLPAHAQYQFRQGTWYVYFPYCLSLIHIWCFQLSTQGEGLVKHSE